jgi:hypothetical protein
MMMKNIGMGVVGIVFVLMVVPLSLSIEVSQSPSVSHSKLAGILTQMGSFDECDEYTTILPDLPPTWDWRNVEGQDWTTPIKDQLQDVCGSCWAFGSLGGLEAMVKIWANNSALPVDLSEQYMLSCSPGGCEGWYWMQTLNWIKIHGAIPEVCFGYAADDAIPCNAKCPEWDEQLIGIDDYHHVSSNVSVIQSALVAFGPLPATMDVYEDFYPNYTGGVYEYTWGDYVFGHCVTIVGYDNTWGDEDQGYWIVKNSWGTAWGELGWFRIAYGQCKIEKGVYYYEGPNYISAQPDPPVGPNEGKPGETYTYSAVAYDPDDDDIQNIFDWGDGNMTSTSSVGSGDMVSVNYSWLQQGTYQVRVMVQDSHGLQSGWSDPLEVTIPKNHNRQVSLLHWLETWFSLHSSYPSIRLI